MFSKNKRKKTHMLSNGNEYPICSYSKCLKKLTSRRCRPTYELIINKHDVSKCFFNVEKQDNKKHFFAKILNSVIKKLKLNYLTEILCFKGRVDPAIRIRSAGLT